MKQSSNHILRRSLALLAGVALLAAPMGSVQARIIFQNDEEFEMDADNLVIDFDADTDATDIYVKFGNSGTASENGTINWDITNEQFEIDDDIVFTQYFDASATTGFRMRQVAGDPNTLAACANVDELVFRTDNNSMYYCTATGAAGVATWDLIGADASSATATSFGTAADNATAETTFFGGSPSQGDAYYNTTDDQVYTYNGSAWVPIGPQDFEDVFAFDADNTLTADADFSINTGANELDLTTTGLLDINADDIDIDATGNVSLVATGTLEFSSANWSIDTDGDADLRDITADGAVDFTGASSTQITEKATVLGSTCDSTGELAFDTTNNTVYVCTDAGADTWVPLGGGDIKTEVLEFHPEFPNAVIDEDTGKNIAGTNNHKGVLVGDYDSTEDEYYYGWQTRRNNLQDINVKFRIPIPEDFVNFETTNAISFKVYPGDADETYNDIDYDIDIVGGANCDSGLASADDDVTFADATWDTVILDLADLACSPSPGDTLEFTFTMQVDDTENNAEIRVGRTIINYTAY